MTRWSLPAFATAATLLVPAAFAASVQNRDPREHKITVIEGDAQKDHVLKPDEVLRDICLKGCLIRLGDGSDDPYELEGSEVTSIEDGQLYDDAPEAPSTPQIGEDGQPSLPGTAP